MEISVKNICQMVLVFFFFGPEKRIEMYHLQNPGTFFAVSSNPKIYGTENFSFFSKNEKNGST